ncbi:MAG TPA: PHP domain-containing protein [Actinobacteria bacterium]|nr:PHP domain-containing protein [Actinomycetota bacterium]
MIDLHLHTTASDGTYAPEKLVAFAFKLGLKVIAISDHDSVDGIEPAIKEGKRLGIEVVPALELGSNLKGRDIHILGYYIDFKHPWLRQHLNDLREARRNRALKMVDRLCEMRIDVLPKDVLKIAGDSSAVGRVHLARVMLEKGYIDSIQDAFDTYIGKDGPCYVEKNTYSPQEAIEIIKKVGGVPVLAHPAVSKVDEFIPNFIDSGLQGLEVYHSRHTKQQTVKYKKLAKKLGLIVTGGSDCHGLSGELLINSVNVPNSVLNNLKKLKISSSDGG